MPISPLSQWSNERTVWSPPYFGSRVERREPQFLEWFVAPARRTRPQAPIADVEDDTLTYVTA